MREEDNLEIRSEDVQEILGNPPHWMVRYGSFLALGVLMTFFWLAYYVRYPDKVKSEITISFTEPPRTLVAPQSGIIDRILVNNNDKVTAGQTLMVFKSTADYNHVLHLRDLMESLPDEADSTLMNFAPMESLDLGELQEDFFRFLEKQSEYRRRYEQYAELEDVQSLQRQRTNLQRSLRFFRDQQDNLESRLADSQQERLNKERLVRQNRLPYREVQKVEERIENLQTDLRKTREIISDRELEISILNGQISKTERGVSENRLTASDALKESFFQLRKRVEEWVQLNILQAPIGGIVQITGRDISKDQFIVSQNEVMVVVPVDNRQLLGRMFLEFNGSGPVREDQEVIVRLDAYPYQDYGAVIGQVSWKSKVPTQKNKIPVEVVFPNGLTTTLGKDIDPGEELTGVGYIILNDRRFINRIVDWGRSFRLL